MTYAEIQTLLGDQAEDLLQHTCQTITKDQLSLPNPNFVDQVFMPSDRNNRVLTNLERIFNHGRLAGTGYLSILPVDQGIEHTAGFSFSPNPQYFDPEKIVKLAIEGGTNAVASTLGILGLTSRKYAAKIPFIVKINHNELLTYPNKHDQILFARVTQAWNMGAAGIGATIYFGSKESNRQIQEIGGAFRKAHELGMATILWCYVRNEAFVTHDHDYHFSADITGQANHLGATIEADIVKQKFPENNGGFAALNFGKYNQDMYTKLATNHPIDLVRYQVVNAYMGKIGLLNSGGVSSDNDHYEAVRTAVINKRGGGMGLISGRKVFQKPFEEGIKLLHIIQDVYLEKQITVA